MVWMLEMRLDDGRGGDDCDWKSPPAAFWAVIPAPYCIQTKPLHLALVAHSQICWLQCHILILHQVQIQQKISTISISRSQQSTMHSHVPAMSHQITLWQKGEHPISVVALIWSWAFPPIPISRSGKQLAALYFSATIYCSLLLLIVALCIAWLI